jgi:hypothetical protein
MPTSISEKCESFIHNNIEKIIDLVVDNLTPDQICAALKMCASKKPVRIKYCFIVIKIQMYFNKSDVDTFFLFTMSQF